MPLACHNIDVAMSAKAPGMQWLRLLDLLVRHGLTRQVARQRIELGAVPQHLAGPLPLPADGEPLNVSIPAIWEKLPCRGAAWQIGLSAAGTS